MYENKIKRILYLLLFIGWALRISYVFMIEKLERDEITYLNKIENITNKTIIEEDEDILNDNALIYLGKKINHLFDYKEASLRALGIVISLFWIVALYKLGLQVFKSRRIGLLSALLAVFNPYMIRISCKILRDQYYGFLVCCILIVIGKLIRKKSIFHIILLGQLIVLGIWFRIEGFEMLVISQLLIYWVDFKKYRNIKSFQRILVLDFSIAVGFILVYILAPEYYGYLFNKVSTYIH